jgi:hypothetical protein
MPPIVVFNVQQRHFDNHQGGNIGGVAPLHVAIDQTSKKPATTFYTEGNSQPGKIPMVDWYTTIPVDAGAKNLSLAYDLTPDGRVAGNGWALERDVKLTKSGKTANFSFECVITSGWKLQISKFGGGWADIGASIPPLTANIAHHFLHRYAFDFGTWKYSYLAINIDGQEFPVPTGLQNLAFEDTGWSDGALFQFQQDSRPDLSDPAFMETLENCTMTTW